MLRRTAPALLILITFILDTTVIPVFYGGVYTVPLTLVVVFLIGMLMGRMQGLLYGTIGGLLIDITSGTLGMMTFFFMAVGFLIGLILYDPSERLRTDRRKAAKRRIQRAIWVFALDLLGEVVLFIIQYFSTADLQWIYLLNMLVRALICTLLTLLFRSAAYRALLGNDRRRRPVRDREVKSF